MHTGTTLDKIQRQRNRSFGLDDWHRGKHCRWTHMCMCVPDFCQPYPVPAFPACPPTQHMSPAPRGFLVPNPSRHLILRCVISTRIICGSHASLCPLCPVLADGDAFLSINREGFTLQPNFHQRDFLSLCNALCVPVKGTSKLM